MWLNLGFCWIKLLIVNNWFVLISCCWYLFKVLKIVLWRNDVYNVKYVWLLYGSLKYLDVIVVCYYLNESLSIIFLYYCIIVFLNFIFFLINYILKEFGLLVVIYIFGIFCSGKLIYKKIFGYEYWRIDVFNIC